MTGHEVFGQEIQMALELIRQICAHWDHPELGRHLTLILRDPTNDRSSVVFGAEDIEGVIRVLRHLQRDGVRVEVPRDRKR